MEGGYGRFSKSDEPPVYYSPNPVMFVLPDARAAQSVGAGPRTVTLAVRVWMGIFGPLREPDAGGLHVAPLLGDSESIAAKYKVDWYQFVHNFLYSPLQTVYLLLIALMAASMLLFDRSDRAYMWVAAVLLFSAICDFIITMGILLPHIVNARFLYGFFQIVYMPLHMGGWAMVWWVWFRLKRPVWVTWVIGVLTIGAMITGALAEGVFQGAVPHAISPVFLTATTIVRAFLLSVMVFIMIKGIVEHGVDGWLVLPTLFPLALVHFQAQLANRYLPLYWHWSGFVFSIENLANFLLGIAVALLMLRRLLLSVRRQRQLALDIKQAQEVQQVILPEPRIVLPGMVVECVFRPAMEVGGDFFQVIPHPTDGSLLIVAGDVTGKGLPAGMLVALLVGAIRTLAPSDPDPLSILAVLNQRLYGRRQAHATCLALRIAANGEATLANAGHLPPYINGEPVEVDGTLPLGIIETPEFSVANFFLAENDRLSLVSDGVIEATNAQSQLFGFERLHELLKQGATAADISAAAQSFGQQDDISVISVSYVGRESIPSGVELSTEGTRLGAAPA
jgi:hypothetical protein